MKRFLALLLALTLLLGLSGCGDVDPELVGQAIEEYEQLVGEYEELLTEFETLPEWTEGAAAEPTQTAAATLPTDDPELPQTGTTEYPLDEYGCYYTAEEVALYIDTYGWLPCNYITKSEARDLGWEGGSVEYYAPGCAIGGDRFYNYEEQLPGGGGMIYYECDIDTDGYRSRGAKRLVFNLEGDIYYTDDHYETFICLYGEELP